MPENYQEYRNNWWETTQWICWTETGKSDNNHLTPPSVKTTYPILQQEGNKSPFSLTTSGCWAYSQSRLNVTWVNILPIEGDESGWSLHAWKSYISTESVCHGNLRVNNTSDSVACLEDFNTPVSDPSPEHSVTRSSTRKRRRKGMRRMFLHADNTGWLPNERRDQDIPHKVGICNWQGQRLKPESSIMPYDATSLYTKPEAIHQNLRYRYYGPGNCLYGKVECSGVMDSLWYRKEMLMHGSSWDQTNITISKIKGASDVSIHSQDAIQCRPLQENATKSAWTAWRTRGGHVSTGLCVEVKAVE